MTAHKALSIKQRYHSYDSIFDMYTPQSKSGDIAADIKELERLISLNKIDDPLLTGTTNALNYIYGLKAAVTLPKIGAPVINALPKIAPNHVAFRTIEALSTAPTEDGIAEYGSFPETRKPTIGTIKIVPKTNSDTFDTSQLKNIQERVTDQYTWTDLKNERAMEHVLKQETQALLINTTATSNRLTSLDKIVSSYDEVTNAGGMTPGDSDVYNINRDAAATEYDSQVIHGSGSTLAFSTENIDELIARCEPYWQTLEGDVTYNNKLFITTPQTRKKWKQEAKNSLWVTAEKVNVSPQGIQVAGDHDYNTTMNSYDKIPIITTPKIDDHLGSLGDIFLLDLDHIGYNVFASTYYMERGPEITGKYGVEGIYTTIGEIEADKFGGHGKIRDQV
jgi:hypothetical protein